MKDCCLNADNFVAISKAGNCVHMIFTGSCSLLVSAVGERKLLSGKKLNSRFVGLPSKRVRLSVVLATSRKKTISPTFAQHSAAFGRNHSQPCFKVSETQWSMQQCFGRLLFRMRPRADSVYNPGHDPLPHFSPLLKFTYFSFEYWGYVWWYSMCFSAYMFWKRLHFKLGKKRILRKCMQSQFHVENCLEEWRELGSNIVHIGVGQLW